MKFKCSNCGELIESGLINIGEHYLVCPEVKVIMVYGDMHAIYVKRKEIDYYANNKQEADDLMKKQIKEFFNSNS